MHKFYSTKGANKPEDFKNLVDAIKLHDDYFITQSLRDNPEFATQKTPDGMTILMLAAINGCSQDVFTRLLAISKPVINDKSTNGQTVESILKANNRVQLLNLLNAAKDNDSTALTPDC